MRGSIITILIYFYLSSCNGQDNNNIETNNKKNYLERISNNKETDNGIIYLSFDDGDTWQNASSGLAEKISIGLGGVAVSERLLGVATKEYGVYFYNFKDSNWINVPTNKEIIESNIGALALLKNTI